MALTKVSDTLFVGPRSEIRVEAGNGHGSTNTKIRRYSTTVINTGSDITYADSATIGGTFTINTAGLYFMAVTDANSANPVQVGISHNSNQLTTNLYNITAVNRIAYVVPVTNIPATTSTMKICAAGDVIRVHTDGSVNRTDIESWFYIAKVSP